MTPQQLEDFAQEIALATVHTIYLGGDQGLASQGTSSLADQQKAREAKMNASALAWVERSRNLAKLWAFKTPTKSIDQIQAELDAEEQSQQAAQSQQAETTQDGPVRRRPGRPAHQ